ncbi:pre T-cell antigen receptor alpha [Tupaia chinensis]|uniref:pre T-cell antigen receptor alpha n=1 Tax=Tupaia chinensis TaxID=246437 RepID=UPI0003C91B02|nr:pre T-cell antigen receptor alpha [Tupaia chinensis]
MAGPWLLLLLSFGCPALPTGLGSMPFPSLAPPITLLVDGKPQTLVICLVFDVAPHGFDSPIWFSAGNGSALDAFTYGPSSAMDGTWTRLAQLSLPSEELTAWEPLVCHTGPRAGGHSQSTQPLQLSGEVSRARACFQEPLRGTQGQALWLGALRLLLFKLLLFDVLLTCSRLRAGTATRAHPHGPAALRALALGPHRLRSPSPPLPAPRPLASQWVRTCGQGQRPRNSVREEARGRAWAPSACSALTTSSNLEAFLVHDLPPPADRTFLEAGRHPSQGFLIKMAASLPSGWEPLQGSDLPRYWDI